RQVDVVVLDVLVELGDRAHDRLVPGLAAVLLVGRQADLAQQHLGLSARLEVLDALLALLARHPRPGLGPLGGFLGPVEEPHAYRPPGVVSLTVCDAVTPRASTPVNGGD